MESLLIFILCIPFLIGAFLLYNSSAKPQDKPTDSPARTESKEQQQWGNDPTDLDPFEQKQRELLKREIKQKELAIKYVLRSKKRDHLTENELKDLSKIEERTSKIVRSLSERRYQTPNEKSGFVYIISNPAFRSNIVKIGMTCGVDPAERVRGLYNTSTPLHFDIQMLHYSENALYIERSLHEIFSRNRVNARREFFYATPVQIREALRKFDGAVIYFNPAAEVIESN